MDNADKEMARVAGRIATNVALAAVGLQLKGPISSGTWDPVEPPDLHLAKLPPVAKDGTVECSQCNGRILFANANIATQRYVCSPCTLARAREEARTSAYANAENVKLAKPKLGIYFLIASLVIIAGLLAFSGL